MFLNRVASISRQMLSRKALPFKTAGIGARQQATIALPGRRKLSGAENLGLFTILFVSMWIIPAWVLYYIPEYQKEDRNKYTGV